MEKRVRKYKYEYRKITKKAKSNKEYEEEGVRNMKIIMKRHNHLNKR